MGSNNATGTTAPLFTNRNKTVTWPVFTCVSSCKEVALELAGDGGGLCVITVPAGTGAQLHTLSMYPTESEILLPANSCFEVTDVCEQNGHKEIHLTFIGLDFAAITMRNSMIKHQNQRTKDESDSHFHEVFSGAIKTMMVDCKHSENLPTSGAAGDTE